MRRVRFAYYEGLGRAEKSWYRKSDASVEVPIRDARGLRPLLPPVEQALAADDRAAVEKATRALVEALLVRLDAPPVVVKVMAVRPADGDGELHGLYVAEEGKKPVLRVWMRTAAQRRPVAFRTFVRTVLHEVVHHLDFQRERWPHSFHTEGFFKRESHLARQLLGVSPKRKAAGRTAPRDGAGSDDAAQDAGDARGADRRSAVGDAPTRRRSAPTRRRRRDGQLGFGF